MLPNHAPLMIAEQFGTLAELYPDRIDLGLGRAPGTDMLTARALRRNMDQTDTFPQDVMELIGYLDDPVEGAKIRAVPGMGTKVPVWILGSSLYGAEMAALLRPALCLRLALCARRTFQCLENLPAQVPAVEISRQAAFHDGGQCIRGGNGCGRRVSSNLHAAGLHQPENRAPPAPCPHRSRTWNPSSDLSPSRWWRMPCAISAVGAPETVKNKLADLTSTYQPDEVIITGQIHDHTSRLNSFRIAAHAMKELNAETV